MYNTNGPSKMHAWSGQLIFWIQSRWCAVMGKFFCTDLNITNWLLPYPAQIISSPKVKIFNKTTPFLHFSLRNSRWDLNEVQSRTYNWINSSFVSFSIFYHKCMCVGGLTRNFRWKSSPISRRLKDVWLNLGKSHEICHTSEHQKWSGI